MRALSKFALLALAVLPLTGCGQGSARQILGMDRTSPDAFSVSPQRPLDIPRDLTQLPAPRPGLGRPNAITPELEAQSVIVGAYPVANRDVAAQGLSTPSAAEEALLQKTNAAAVDPNIRAQVDKQAKKDAETQTKGWASWLVFWRDKPKPGVVVDAKAEAERLKAAKAEGKPVTEGATPVREDSGRLKMPKEIQ